MNFKKKISKKEREVQKNSFFHINYDAWYDYRINNIES